MPVSERALDAPRSAPRRWDRLRHQGLGAERHRLVGWPSWRGDAA